MNRLNIVLGWIFGLLFLVIGIGVMVGGPVVPALALFFASFLCFPPALKALNIVHSKTNIKIPIKLKIALICGLLLVGMLLEVQGTRERIAQELVIKQQEEKTEALKIAAAEQQQNVEYFKQNSVQILADVEKAIKAKDFKNAVSMASKYAPSKNQQLIELNTTANAELIRTNRQEKTKVILAQMKTVPVTEFATRLQMSQRLAALNPDNTEFAKMVVLYSGKAKEQEKKVQLVLEKNRKDEETWRAKYGAPPSQANSGWCPAVVNYLKEQLNDPDSLAMGDCTKAELTSGGWLLHCSFRAKNGFGALVKESRSFWVHRERVIYVQGD